LQHEKCFVSFYHAKSSIIFSTYQSSKVLSKAVSKSGAKFDIGIFDEAHRTAGTKVGAWSIALDDAIILALFNYREQILNLKQRLMRQRWLWCNFKINAILSFPVFNSLCLFYQTNFRCKKRL